METAKETWFATFTYGGKDTNPASTWLDYADLRRLFARLRRAGYRFQYVAVGEYGSQHGRAHFHVLFFWESDPPPAVMGQRISWPFWKLGFSQLEFPRSKQAAACYMLDYITKENLRENVLKYSKRPALGTEYLLQYARQRAKAGLALFQNGARFTVPGNQGRSGLFWYDVDTSSRIYRLMLQEYLDTWAEFRGTKPMPSNEHIDEYLYEVSLEAHKQSPVVQAYLLLVYDIAAVQDFPRKLATVYTTRFDGLLMVVAYGKLRFEVRDFIGARMCHHNVNAESGEFAAIGGAEAIRRLQREASDGDLTAESETVLDYVSGVIARRPRFAKQLRSRLQGRGLSPEQKSRLYPPPEPPA